MSDPADRSDAGGDDPGDAPEQSSDDAADRSGPPRSDRPGDSRSDRPEERVYERGGSPGPTDRTDAGRPPTARIDDPGDDGAVDADEPDGPSLAGVLGAEPSDSEEIPRPSIEPESPELENVVFVLLGIALSLFVVYRLVVVFG